MDTFRYGIFKLGQIWTLTDQDGARLGFASREIAIAALQTMIAVHDALGAVVVTLQSRDGRLRTLLNPRDDDLAREDEDNATAWNGLFAVGHPAPPAHRAANESAANEDVDNSR